MTFRTERCPIGDNVVTLVTDFEGTVNMVICPDYQYATGTCGKRTRRENASPLTDFLSRVKPPAKADRLSRCPYWPS